MIDTSICAAADAIANANSILIITGAGISADSGLPTYRGVGGLYNDSNTEDGYAIEEALSATVWQHSPEITWKYLWQIGRACYAAKANRAHVLIRQIQQQKPNTWVLTQNIDGLHKQVGTQQLIEIHGNAFSLYCCKCHDTCKAEDIFHPDQQPKLPIQCRQCGGLVRPNVVLFEEALPTEAIDQLMQVLETPPDLVLAIGTSAAFPYIIQPFFQAHHQGQTTIEINPQDTDLTPLATIKINLGAADAMEQIWQKFAEQMSL